MKSKLLNKIWLRSLAVLTVMTTAFAGQAWGQTYEQLTSIASIDESAQYVLGINGTGFHYEGTSSWGKTALPSAHTPIYYTLTKASNGESFTATATISGTTYYLQVPTSNTFSMATSSGTNTDLIIGTTQVSGTNYAVANKSTKTRHLRINGTSGLRSYAGTTGTMAFFYKVIAGSSVNTSVTINASGITNRDVYVSTEAGTLTATVKDASGNVISEAQVTWSSDNTDVATVSNGVVTLVGEGTANITAEYAGLANTYNPSSATYKLTVTDSTPFTGGTVTFVAGTDVGSSSGTGNNDQLTKSEVVISCSNAAFATSEYRFYKNSETTISVSENYYISQIVFTNADTSNPCSNLALKNGTPGEYSNNTWTGASRTATFMASAQARASRIAVTVVSGSAPPIINAANVNLASDATGGSITATIQNAVDGGQLSASSSASWLIIGTINENTVPFTCSANTATTSRQATVTLTYTYNTNQTVTTTVSVTQAAYVAPFTPSTYTLVNELTSGKHYIITSAVTDDGYVKAMGAQKSNNRAAVEVEVTGNTANVNSADVSEFVIYGPDANGRFAIYDPTNAGYLYAASGSNNYLKTQASNNVNGQWSISFSNNVASIVADVSSNRNVMQYNSSSDGLFSCYASDSQSPVYLYVKSDEATPSVPVSITSAGLATFSSINAVDFTDADAVEVYTATVGTDGKITYNSISKVPANTGVVLRSTEGNSVNISVPTLSGGADVIAANDLVAVSQTIEHLASTNEDGTTNYILNIVNDKLGFYKANNQMVAAGKAYLKAGVDESRSFIGVDDMTGIESIAATVSDGQYYDLQGRRVAQPQKGLYIVNGKKVIIK